MSERVKPEAGAVRFFSDDHRACDERWTQVEAAVQAGDAAGTAAAFQAFEQSMRRHLAMEEEVLFPAFEQATGITMGPTRVMRFEHDQMRGLLDQMAAAAQANDGDALLDHGDTLLMLIQQHNVKEEGMLYPMAEAHLGHEWPAIAGRLQRY